MRRFGVTVERYPLPGGLDARLRELLATREVNLALDVGANRGQYARRLRHDVGFNGWIISFEPSTQDFDVLSQRMGSDGRWLGKRCAVSDRSGSSILHVYAESEFSSLETPSELGLARWPTLRSARPEETALCTLDDLLDELLESTTVAVPRVLMKTDTQGHDLRVIQGAQRVLQHVEILQVELAFERSYDGAPHYAEALSTLEACGFAVSAMYPIAWSADGQGLLECDCILVRRR